MSAEQIEIQLIACVVAAACALPGVFLILRKMAMMSDAVSHAILPGIVVAFFVTQTLHSPWLLIGAAAAGLLTVVLVELLYSTRLVKEDAAIGLVFPVLFSVGVVLIAKYAGDIHLDTDAVLSGELAFAPFDRFIIGGVDIGPKSLVVMSGVLLLNAAFIGLFYKELKIATFDAGLAATLGFMPGVMHYALMSLVSITSVGAFDAVGSILVVALMIAPPACAFLLTDRLSRMIAISIGFGIASAISGYWVAHWFDVSIAGCMASAAGVLFTIVVFFAPHRGLISVWSRNRRLRWAFAEKMLAIHLEQHAGQPEESRENRAKHLEEHLRWSPAFASRVVDHAVDDGFIITRSGLLILTDAGRALASEAVTAE
jgi:manganese/zinc/iron transport system permease protein